MKIKIKNTLAILLLVFFCSAVTTWATWPAAPALETVGGWLGTVFDLTKSDSTQLILKSNKIGIGTTGTLNEKMEVNGNIKASGFIGNGSQLTNLNEQDPKIGTVETGKWCAFDGTKIQCNNDKPDAGTTVNLNDFKIPTGLYGNCVHWISRLAAPAKPASCSELWPGAAPVCTPATPANNDEYTCDVMGSPFTCQIAKGCICPSDYMKVKTGVEAEKSFFSCLKLESPPLYGSKHTEDGCTLIGGTVQGSGTNKFCRLAGGICPKEWTQYANWTTTTPTKLEYDDVIKCAGGTCRDCGTFCGPGTTQKKSCTTKSHAWSNLKPEECSFTYRTCAVDMATGLCPTYGNVDGFQYAAWGGGSTTTVNATQTATPVAKITEIGCY